MMFSALVWSQTAPLYQEILNHPFNQELAHGTLDPSLFRFYLAQDVLYLKDFARALAYIAARSNSSSHIRQFLEFSLGALIAEQEVHAHFLGPLHSLEEIAPTNACMGYTRFLIATSATAPIEEAMAAVLPCFWIYREVGQAIASHNRSSHPYKRWIDTYSSQEFAQATEIVIGLCDEIAEQCTTKQQERMQLAFKESATWEWHFWNDAYLSINRIEVGV